MKILVPVDDDIYASLITAFIGNHLWPQASEFLVLHTVDSSDYDSFDIAFSSLIKPTLKEALDDATVLVERAAAQLQQIFPELTVNTVVNSGEPGRVIAKVARDWSADLIVAGSHGRRGFNRLVLGSVSLALLADAPCSVLLVKPDCENQISDSDLRTEKSKPFVGRILVAVDETPVSDRIIDFIVQHKWSAGAHFKVISIVRYAHAVGLYPTPALSGEQGLVLARRREHLKAAFDKLKTALPDHQIVSELMEGDEKQLIAQMAHDWSASLIIIGHHHRHGMQKLFGSASLATFSAAPCSVMMLGEKINVIEGERDLAVSGSVS